MRVGVDEQAVVGQTTGGISRYVVELVRALSSAPQLGVEVVPGWRYGSTEQAQQLGLARRPPLRGSRLVERASAYAANRAPRRAARRADIWHHTYYSDRFLRPPLGGRSAVTVYDLIPDLYPDLFPQGDPHLRKRAFVESADVVLCISESTRRDLLEVYGDPGVPVVVTPLGVADEWFAPDPVPAADRRPMLLFVGKRLAYKDFDVVLNALRSLPPGVELVAAGGGPFAADEVRRIDSLGLGGRVRQTSATDAQLARLYSEAAAMVFPSRHEGFGLTTLEAMASGCPVVLARTSSHPEVGGEAAEYFSPQDHADLAAVLARLLDDAGHREQMAQAGLRRARAMSWQATAAATAAAYRLVTGP